MKGKWEVDFIEGWLKPFIVYRRINTEKINSRDEEVSPGFIKTRKEAENIAAKLNKLEEIKNENY